MSSNKINNNIKKNNNSIEDNNKITRRYREVVEPRLDEIKAWARDGVSEEEMAKRLGIAYSTFRNYKDMNLAFLYGLRHKIIN